MKRKIGDMDEQQFKTLVRAIVFEVVNKVVEEKIEQTKPKWADRMMTNLDENSGEYKKFTEEKTVLSGQVANHGEAIEDIDERVKKIEQKFGFA